MEKENPNPVPLSSPQGIHRRLYAWVLSLAHYRYAIWALFALSFAEASFFPIAPDVLQIALTLERPENGWRYAAYSTIGSVLGGCLGYGIGILLWSLTAPFFLTYVFSAETFQHVSHLYQRWDFWAVFVAAFTPIPYKVFTIAAGVFHISFPMFVVASLVGRGGRFFLVAFLLRWKGPAIKLFIERYFNILCLALVMLLLAGFMILKSGIG